MPDGGRAEWTPVKRDAETTEREQNRRPPLLEKSDGGQQHKVNGCVDIDRWPSACHLQGAGRVQEDHDPSQREKRPTCAATQNCYRSAHGKIVPSCAKSPTVVGGLHC